MQTDQYIVISYNNKNNQTKLSILLRYFVMKNERPKPEIEQDLFEAFNQKDASPALLVDLMSEHLRSTTEDNNVKVKELNDELMQIRYEGKIFKNFRIFLDKKLKIKTAR